MEYSNNDALYVRNAQKWKIYKINEVELVLDTQSDNTTIFPYVFNTYEMVITWYKPSIYTKDFSKVLLHFNITFTDPSDMNLYFIGDSRNQIMHNSYGDRNFNLRLDEFYMGPNMRFGFELLSYSHYNSNMTLPKVFNTYDDALVVFKLPSRQSWKRALALRFHTHSDLIIHLALQWIYSNYIEHYTFNANSDEFELHKKKEYLTSNFIDHYVTSNSIYYYRNKEVLIILSKESNSQKYDYIAHIFDIEEDKIFWIDKFLIDLRGQKLRTKRPLIPLISVSWIIFVEESEKTLHFVPDDPNKKEYIFNSESKVMFAYPVFGNQLYISHYDDSKVSIYKAYSHYDELGRNTISIEYIRNQDFKNTYLWVDIDIYGLVLIFTKSNYRKSLCRNPLCRTPSWNRKNFGH